METETVTLTCPKEVYHKDLEDTIIAIKEVIGSAKKSIVLNLYLNSKEPTIGLRTKINSLYPTSSIWTQKNERKTTENQNLVFIKCGNKLVKVDLKTILFAHTDSKNYCSIVTSDGKKLSVRYSIQKLTKRLNTSVFVQTHRSYIINWEKINSFHESDQTIDIEGHHIPIGRTFKESVYKKMRII